MGTYLLLFTSFAKVGAVTFGGGYAMLPILQREVVERRGWVRDEELMDYYAVGQCTPGVIAVNVATFVGGKIAGWRGAAVATLGMVFPSLVLLTMIAALISNFQDIAWVRNAFAGIRVCVCVLIFNAVLKLWKSSVLDVKTGLMFCFVFLASLFLDFSPVLYVIVAGVMGILLHGFRKDSVGEKNMSTIVEESRENAHEYPHRGGE